MLTQISSRPPRTVAGESATGHRCAAGRRAAGRRSAAGRPLRRSPLRWLPQRVRASWSWLGCVANAEGQIFISQRRAGSGDAAFVGIPRRQDRAR